MTPAAKFFKESWRDKLIARPAPPTRAINEVVLTPSLLRAMILIINTRIHPIMEQTKFTRMLSTFALDSTFLTILTREPDTM